MAAQRGVLGLSKVLVSKRTPPFRCLATSSKPLGNPTDQPSKDDKTLEAQAQHQEKKSRPKTVAEADEEMMRKLAGISGEGGASGVEYEDGKPVAMKRGVRNNMFRLI